MRQIKLPSLNLMLASIDGVTILSTLEGKHFIASTNIPLSFIVNRLNLLKKSEMRKSASSVKITRYQDNEYAPLTFSVVREEIYCSIYRNSILGQLRLKVEFGRKTVKPWGWEDDGELISYVRFNMLIGDPIQGAYPLIRKNIFAKTVNTAILIFNLLFNESRPLIILK